MGSAIFLVLMIFLTNTFADEGNSREKFYVDLGNLSPKTYSATKLVDEQISTKCGITPSIDFLIDLMSTQTFAILISLPAKFQPHYANSAIKNMPCPTAKQ